MNGIDIIFILIGIFALWQGYRKGIIIQLSGIIGIILGAYVAYRWCDEIASFIGISGEYKSEITFAATILAFIIVMVILGRAMSNLLQAGGLGGINNILGAAFSLVKTILIVSLITILFDAVNQNSGWVEEKTIAKSKLYQPVKSISSYIFPYIDFASKHIKAFSKETFGTPDVPADSLKYDTTTLPPKPDTVLFVTDSIK